MAHLETGYGLVVAFLARFSEAFLLLRGESTGLTATYAPVILIVMNVAKNFGRSASAHRARRMRVSASAQLRLLSIRAAAIR